MESYGLYKEREWPQTELIKSQMMNSEFIIRQRPYPAIYFEGGVSYQPNVDYITISIEKVSTTQTSGQTQLLMISLLTSDHQFRPGQPLKPGVYDTVAMFELQPLLALQFYSNIKKEVQRKSKFTRPYSILLLENGGDIVDWVNFKNTHRPIAFVRGDTAFKAKGDEIEISIDRIMNSHASGRTGHIRVRLLSSQGKFRDSIHLNPDSYEVAAEFILEPILAGVSYEGVCKRVKAINHIRRKQSILTISQFQNEGFAIKDWRYFPEETSEGSVFFSGSIKYDMFMDSVNIYIDKVACNKIYSGSLKVSLITSDTKYMSDQSSYSGFLYLTVASFNIEPLSRGEFFKSISKKCQQETKKLKKQMVVIVESLDGSKWKVEDWRNLGFPQQQKYW